MKITRATLRLCMVVIIVLTVFYFRFFVLHVMMSQQQAATLTANNSGRAKFSPQQQQEEEEERCAINLYGLPRAFASIVLPSLVKNVISTNAPYHCDYFIHYYNLTSEVAGRSGTGGELQPQEILLLREQVLQQHLKTHGGAATSTGSSSSIPAPTVVYAVGQEADFWKQYETLLKKIHDSKDENGKYLYFPWRAKTYKFPTTVDNILKMWHSIQSSWNLMENHAKSERGAKGGRRHRPIRYTRVAMLRSDVMYLTPIDIWAESNGLQRNVKNDQAVIPGFGRHPVSDRLIYGPYEAVKPWATMRFSSLEGHVQWMHDHDPGWAMHSERFVNSTLLSRIKKLGYTVAEHDSMCFFRARADESVWITDCSSNDPKVSKVMPTLPGDMKGAVEKVLGRSCGEIVKVTHTFKGLQCPMNNG